MQTANGIDTPTALKILRRAGRIGMITNHSGTAKNLTPSRKIVHDAVGLKALFSPEHGLFGAEQAGGVSGPGTVDPVTGVPCYDIYHARAVADDVLAGLDAIVYDLQDVGSRYYTYLNNAVDAMRICAANGLKFILLDRINPIADMGMEGAPPDEKLFPSNSGVFPIPSCHGLTMGEFALFINDRYRIGCDLTVVPCKGWKRSTGWERTGLQWVAPSPNLPGIDGARVYNGTCLFEGTNLSEGRGTTRPFEIIGAPFLHPADCIRRLAEFDLPGVIFRECYFRPTFSKFAGEVCAGMQVHVTDHTVFRPYETGIRMLQVMREDGGEKFQYTNWMDGLSGTDRIRLGTEDFDTHLALAAENCERYRKETAPWLLYR